MDLDVLAEKERDEFEIDLHQRVGHSFAARFGHRLDPFAHSMEVGTVLAPAIEVEEPLDLLRDGETQQIAGVGNTDFLQGIEERFGREGLHEAFRFGRRQNKVSFLTRRQAIQKLEFLLKRQIQKFLLPRILHTTTCVDFASENTLALEMQSTRGTMKP
jgi:hypothetical protein